MDWNKEQAGAAHAGAVLRVDLLGLGLHAHDGHLVSLAPVLFLDGLELRLHDAHKPGGLLLVDRHRPHEQVDDDGEKDDAESDVGDPEVAREAEQRIHDEAQYIGDLPYNRHC